MVAELDSLLNQWIDTVPDHCKSDRLHCAYFMYIADECAVRWNPNMKDLTFFNQSAYLHAFYFQIQIIVHRQWIPSAKKLSSLSLASLAICTNAARSAIHIIEVQHNRCPRTSYQYIVRPDHLSGFHCILNVIVASTLCDRCSPDNQHMGRQALWAVD